MVPLSPQVVAHMAIMVSTTEILRIIKSRDGPRKTSITIVINAHIVIEDVTQLMCHRLNDFPPNYKRIESSVNNTSSFKTANESETLTNQEDLSSILALV